MGTQLPTHLRVVLHTWDIGVRFLPWSLGLPVLAFTAFEAFVRGRYKHVIREVILATLAFTIVCFCTLTAWSVVDAQNESGVQVFHKHLREQWIEDKESTADTDREVVGEE
jgi:hypothetical protein